jgi:hypothetical protein
MRKEDGGAYSMHREMRNVGDSEGTIPIGRPRCRWEYNIKIDSK